MFEVLGGSIIFCLLFIILELTEFGAYGPAENPAGGAARGLVN